MTTSEELPARPKGLPQGRWLGDFDPLSSAETELIACCARGEVWTPAGWNGERPGETAKTQGNTLRAGLIRFLALGGDANHPVHEAGVMVAGAWIEGKLDLHQCTAVFRLYFNACEFESEPIFLAANVPELALNGSRVPGLNAQRLFVNRGLFLNNGFEARGEVRLLGARIGSNLECGGGQFANPDGNCLSADGAIVEGDVFLNQGFAAQGRVRLVRAQIGGNFECNGGQFANPDGDCLIADRAVVKGDVHLNKGFMAQGIVRLPGARIGGSLECDGGRFANAHDLCLIFDGAVVEGNVLLVQGFEAQGEVRLLGAQIGGNLSCDGGRFAKADGDCLTADGAVVKGCVFLHEGFEALGLVRLLGAQIGADLVCGSGQFAKADGICLSADRAIVQGDVYLHQEFEAQGQVRLVGTRIGGKLDCSGGRFTKADDKCLVADGAAVKGALFLRDATFAGAIDLSIARVGTLVDDTSCWNAGGHVLDGFTYDRIVGPMNADSRITWLRSQRPKFLTEDFRPQPWEQLAKVLRDMGHLHEARAVAIAKQKAMRRAGVHGLPALRNPFGRKEGWRGNLKAAGEWCMAGFRHPIRLLDEIRHNLFGVLTGYGYAPWRVLGWTVAIWAGFAGLYWELGIGCQELAQCKGHVGPALSYSADALLPADLGLVKSSLPSGDIVAPKAALTGFRFLTIVQTLLGWVMGFLIIGVIGAMIRKD